MSDVIRSRGRCARAPRNVVGIPAKFIQAGTLKLREPILQLTQDSTGVPRMLMQSGVSIRDLESLETLAAARHLPTIMIYC